MSEFDKATGLLAGSFAVGTFRASGGADFPALVLPDGTTFDLSAWYLDTHAMLEDWDRAEGIRRPLPCAHSAAGEWTHDAGLADQ